MKSMLIIAASIVGGIILLIGIEAFFAQFGEEVLFKNPDRKPQTFGREGKPLKYLVMGDSTAVGQGTTPENGFAVQTAQQLAKEYKVTMINTGVSGAKVKGILDDQVPIAEKFKPDLVIISMTANDTVRLTNLDSVAQDAQTIVDRIITANCEAKIVITGSPDMGTVLRFYPPLKQIASWHSRRVTDVMKKVIEKNNLTYAPAYEEVGPPFYKDPSLLSADKYHPNERGYKVWTAMWNKAITNALENQKSHCTVLSKKTN